MASFLPKEDMDFLRYFASPAGKKALIAMKNWTFFTKADNEFEVIAAYGERRLIDKIEHALVLWEREVAKRDA